MRRMLWPLILLAAMPSAAQRAGTIFLVRHAEKVSDAPDAVLSEAGRRRAQCLSETLRDAGIGAIYVSNVERAQQTAAPLAKQSRVEPVPLKADAVSDFVAKAREQAKRTNVLVVGHSDTVPMILSQMGADEAPKIGAADYDLLFLVETGAGKPRLTTLHYCPSPARSAKSSQQMQRMR